MSKDNPKSADAPVKPAGEKDTGSGRVKHDDRGQAVWEWSVATGAFATDVSDQRLQRLENKNLRLLDDQPTPGNIVKPNVHGTAKGYSPYDSGLLVGKKEAAHKKKDLRKLSEWLKLRKQATTNKDDE